MSLNSINPNRMGLGFHNLNTTQKCCMQIEGIFKNPPTFLFFFFLALAECPTSYLS